MGNYTRLFVACLLLGLSTAAQVRDGKCRFAFFNILPYKIEKQKKINDL